MTTYQGETDTLATLCQSQGSAWKTINPEYATRMRLQNRFRSGVDIAQLLLTLCVKTWLHTTKTQASTHSL